MLFWFCLKGNFGLKVVSNGNKHRTMETFQFASCLLKFLKPSFISIIKYKKRITVNISKKVNDKYQLPIHNPFINQQSKTVLFEGLQSILFQITRNNEHCGLQNKHYSDYDVSLQGKNTKTVKTLQKNNQQQTDCFEIALSEEKYRSLFTNMTEGFSYCKMLFDSNNNPVDFIYLEVNDAFEKLTGLKKDAVINKKVTQAIPGIKQANPEVFEIYGRVATSGKSERFEIYFKPLKIWLSILAYCPKHKYFAAIFQNITQRKDLEEKIETYSTGLELTVEDKTNKIVEAQEVILKNERLAAIGELAGMVGHDLRNPLCSIRSAVYVIGKKQQNLNESSLEMLKMIEKSVDYSNKIINDLLYFSRELPFRV